MHHRLATPAQGRGGETACWVLYSYDISTFRPKRDLILGKTTFSGTPPSSPNAERGPGLDRSPDQRKHSARLVTVP